MQNHPYVKGKSRILNSSALNYKVISYKWNVAQSRQDGPISRDNLSHLGLNHSHCLFCVFIFYSPLPLLSSPLLSLPSSRAKEIKSKLGVLLQKPENAIDLIIPYQEKTEKKPEKLQKWVLIFAPFLCPPETWCLLERHRCCVCLSVNEIIDGKLAEQIPEQAQHVWDQKTLDLSRWRPGLWSDHETGLLCGH